MCSCIYVLTCQSYSRAGLLAILSLAASHYLRIENAEGNVLIAVYLFI